MFNNNKVKHIITTMLLLMSILQTHYLMAQNIVTVDKFKGRAQVIIPISSITQGSMTVPVSMEYLAKGIQVKDNGYGNGYGLGWQLNAGGTIERILKDLPDDLPSKGWIYGNNASSVASFVISNDNNSTSCSDEVIDLNYINTNFPKDKDSEPDIFNVSAPGLSCRVVFDKSHKPLIIPYNDYKVTYTTDNYGISSFTIVKDDGTQYLFNTPDLNKKSTSAATINPVPYFNREYVQYTTEISYYGRWYLSSMIDAAGNQISLKYQSGSTEINDFPVEITEKKADNTFGKIKLYQVKHTLPKKFISEITGDNTIKFLFGSDFLRAIILPGERIIYSTYKNISSSTAEGSVARHYLTNISEDGCDALPPYQFFYDRVDLSTGTSILPGTDSYQQDAWGYYNAIVNSSLTPKVYIYPNNINEQYRLNPIPNYSGTYFTINGADRSTNPNVVMASTLNKVVYPTGGSTSLEYEPNTYYDQSANITYIGAGLRVKYITDFDGINDSLNNVTEYVYDDPSTLKTSGKILAMPAFAFTKAYSGGSPGTQAHWESSIVRSDDDLSLESTDVVYSFVTQRKTGNGKTVFEYNIPGTYLDLSDSNWIPSTNYFARANCNSTGALINSKYIYPFAPNPNYDFKRGLLKTVTNFNQSGAKVNRSEYTYQTINSPVIINGLKLDENNGIKTYSKYNILTSSSEYTKLEKEITYDLQDDSKSSESSISYLYGSTMHKQLTKSSIVNSDGTVYNTYFRYVKDYNTSASGDTATIALHGLKLSNANTVIELYKSIVKNNEPEIFISGDVTKFRPIMNQSVSSSCFVPWERLQFLSSDGSSSFQPSQVTAQTTFKNDSKYISVVKYEAYNKYGILTTLLGRGDNVKTYGVDPTFKAPILVIDNARQSEIAYSSFEPVDEKNELAFDEYPYINHISSSRTGQYGFQGSGSSYLQKIINRGKAKEYIFSAWLKSPANGNLTIALTNTSNVTKTFTLPYNSSTEWKYYQYVVPVNDMTSQFTVKIQWTSTLSIDDVLFYPENANVVTYTYDKIGNKLSETDGNGKSLHYTYDGLGRINYIRDHEANILRKESYNSYNTVLSLANPDFKFPDANLLDGVAIPFSANKELNNCLVGVTYNWNFGDGTPVVMNNAIPSHTYATTGTYNITLTAIHPTLGSKSITKPVTIRLRPLAVHIFATGLISMDNCRIQEPLIVEETGYPSASNQTFFNIKNVEGCNGTLTYQWQYRLRGAENWSNVSSVTGTMYSNGSFNPRQTQKAYEIRLQVSSSCGRTGVSNIAEFDVYSSSPDCK
jgi:YD repeat-containing protein